MPRNDQLSTYDYHLPDELIAKVPLDRRDASRMLVLDRQAGSIQHRTMSDLPDFLRPADCLVLNNSRVLPARLRGQRTSTGGKWEGLYLSSTEDGRWRLIGQTRGFLKIDETVTITSPTGKSLTLRLLDKEADGISQFEPQDSRPFVELLEEFASVPLPPYMDRKEATLDDINRYQTTYALHPGSVAAPTAGLHFTPELLDRCRDKGIRRAEVTLHVGIGTFRPVSVEQLTEHKMHTEWCQLSQTCADQLNETRAAGGRIVAVGTTSLRTMESERRDHAAVTDFQEWSGHTNLFIYPPHEFRSAGAMLTNFHLPKSTLLMLVSAFAGTDLILQAYHEAIAERYRFYSYGDAMLIV